MTPRKRPPVASDEVSPPQTDMGPDLAAVVEAEVKKALAPKPGPPPSVCPYCGKRYRRGRASRDVPGGLFACGWCVGWTDREPFGPLTESQILDSAVSRLVGRRTTLKGAAALVAIQPFYAVEGAAPSRRRWAHIDLEQLIRDFDKAYPPARFSGAVVFREVERQGERKIQGTKRTEAYTYTEKLPPEFVPAPLAKPERSPRRPPTEAERLRDAIEAKRRLAARQDRQRQGRIRRIRHEVAKQAKAIARLEARR